MIKQNSATRISTIQKSTIQNGSPISTSLTFRTNYSAGIFSALALTLGSLSFTASAANLPSLPEPIANNAVTKITAKGHDYFLSFNGLTSGKDYQAVTNKAFMLKVGDNNWQTIKPVPIETPVNGLVGRLASVATSINGKAYVFGGYTVAKDHSEVSVPDVYAFNPLSKSYRQLAPMPVPVDDSVALPYQDRYIYLVSGWHNDGNVNLVQVYDVKNDTWQQASPYPGRPVFGQAGAIANDQMIVCDGVRVDVHLDKRRSYAAEPACYLGKISDKSPYKIDWRKVEHPTGTARYRMAAIGDDATNSAYFVGGSDNPYNYSGIGYNGVPSEPDGKVWQFKFSDKQWQLSNAKTATMDHRMLIKHQGQLLSVGGMLKGQEVTDKVIVQADLSK
ncbi:Kelch repeat-containing protein [Thalassotalea euphylliae]|uniref:Kelch repeat-containing protein n=1 Tax=Thalassotalea euphylliae TaxID=1655234 RepID=UPI002682424F